MGHIKAYELNLKTYSIQLLCKIAVNVDATDSCVLKFPSDGVVLSEVVEELSALLFRYDQDFSGVEIVSVDYINLLDGVLYYCLVDPEKCVAKLYQLENGCYLNRGTFTDNSTKIDLPTCTLDFNFSRIWV